MKKIITIISYAFCIIFIAKPIESTPLINNEQRTNDKNITENKTQDSFQYNPFQQVPHQWKAKQLQNNPEMSTDMGTIYDNQDAPVYYTKKEYPLITAAKKNDLETIKKLIEHNVDVNVRDINNKTAYDYAVANSTSWIRSTERKARALEISKLIQPDTYHYRNPDGSIKEVD